MSSMKSKDRKSLCEESMLVFVNILKLSSLSLARRTLVTSSSDNDDDYNHHHHQVSVPKKKATNNQKVVHHNTHVPESQRIKKSKGSKRSQKPEQPPESKLSYVMLPEHDHEITTVDGKFSDYIKGFHEKTEKDLQNAILEGKAANYIKRFHEKNMKDLNNESMRRSHYVLPPPPRQVFK